jgi:hypothetical protein
MTEAAAVSGVPVETLRKIETGRIATPAFFTVAALAASVGLSLEDVVAYCTDAEPASPLARERHRATRRSPSKAQRASTPQRQQP